VLDLYKEEYDPRYPSVCFDEKLVAPEADVRPTEPMIPRQAEGAIYGCPETRYLAAKLFISPENERTVPSPKRKRKPASNERRCNNVQ